MEKKFYIYEKKYSNYWGRRFYWFPFIKIFTKKKYNIIGLDNLNNYYNKKIKLNRVKELKKFKKFKFFKLDIMNLKSLKTIFKKNRIEKVVHLAAQAGVRFSISHPDSYIQNNIQGFQNILELSRLNKIKHLVYASSSSVYGLNKNIPFTEENSASHPISTYAASKRSNELMAHVYSNLYNLPTTGLRFFTVYGPFGRPDMSLFKFVNLTFKNKKVELFNKGNHTRDFTYIDDVTEVIFRAMKKIPKFDKKSKLTEYKSMAPWRIYNVSSSKPLKLKKYINEIEKNLSKKLKYKNLPLQKGDVKKTSGSMNLTIKNFNYKPKYSLKYGINEFVKWYKTYYRK